MFSWQVMMLIDCWVQPIFMSNWNRPLLLTKSNAFERSMKAMSVISCSQHFSWSWRKEHINSGFFSLELTLAFLVGVISKDLKSRLKPFWQRIFQEYLTEKYPGSYCSQDNQPCFFIQDNYLGIAHVLRNCVFSPADAQETMEW